jgi:hypothetical protein
LKVVETCEVAWILPPIEAESILQDWRTFFLPKNCDLGSTFLGLENADKTKNLVVESGIRP